MTERDDWLEWRRDGIGGSDIAALMGISPWASPWSVWADKSGLLPPQPENEYMAAGRWLERAIGPWFTDMTGLFVAGEQMWCTHTKNDWARCTPDGFVFESPLTEDLLDALGAFEVKVTGPGKRWDPLPPYYQAQGQWQMYVTNMVKTWFAVLHGRRLEVYELYRDNADIEFMVERADAFWRDHVLAGVPPATDASDATARALAAVYPEATPGTSVEVSHALIDRWREAKSDLKVAEASEKHLSNELRASLGEAEEGTVDGLRVVTLRTQTSSRTCRECSHETTSDPFRVLRYHPPKEKR
jgi:putative phage-type endonuclease